MIKIKILPHLIIIPAILATQPRSVHHSDWSTGVTSPKTLVTISSLLKYSKAKLSMHIYFISNWHLIVQHLMDSWLSSAKFWEFAFFQELLPLARAVQNLPCVLSYVYNDDHDDHDNDEEYQVCLLYTSDAADE